jgi:hypothetical protein
LQIRPSDMMKPCGEGAGAAACSAGADVVVAAAAALGLATVMDAAAKPARVPIAVA